MLRAVWDGRRSGPMSNAYRSSTDQHLASIEATLVGISARLSNIEKLLGGGAGQAVDPAKKRGNG